MCRNTAAAWSSIQTRIFSRRWSAGGMVRPFSAASNSARTSAGSSSSSWNRSASSSLCSVADLVVAQSAGLLLGDDNDPPRLIGEEAGDTAALTLADLALPPLLGADVVRPHLRGPVVRPVLDHDVLAFRPVCVPEHADDHHRLIDRAPKS